jgi:hypothetical protein
MIDQTARLRTALDEAERDLADAERLRPRPGYGPNLGTEADADAHIEQLRAKRDRAKELLEKYRPSPGAITSGALGSGAVTQEGRAKQQR